MPTDKEVLFIESKMQGNYIENNHFVIYNLQDKSVTSIPFSKTMRLIETHIFCSTKLLCVVGKGLNRLKVRYYEYD